MKYVVSTKAELLTALKSAKAGETVFVRGTAVIDMTGTPSVTIPAGVTLASDRGRAGSAGGLLKRTQNLNGGWEEPMFIAGGRLCPGHRVAAPGRDVSPGLWER